MAEGHNAVEGGNQQNDERLIGVDSDGFEMILLYGCLGFALSVLSAALVLVGVLFQAPDKGECGIVLTCAALVTCVLLWGAQRLTDQLQTKAGRIVLSVIHSVGLAGAAVLLFAGALYPAALCACFGFSAALVSYGRFLVMLVRRALMTVIDIMFVLIGLLVFMLSQAGHSAAFVAVGFPAAVALMVQILFTCKNEPFETLVGMKESKSRSIKVRGNNHTLLQLGFMLGMFLLAFYALPAESAFFALGVAIVLSGVFSLMLRQFDERTYKEQIKRILAFAAALLLLPMALVGNELRAGLFIIYMCIAGLNVVVLVNAVVETARFNMISSIYLLGQEGAVFFAGVFAGSAVSCVAYFEDRLALVGDDVALLAACMLAAIVCAYMQIRVNYQVYPFEPVIETELDESAQATIEHEGHRKTLWQRKREIAGERYGLSPREKEILQILLKGRDAKYIMDTFYISQSTAKTHIYNIYRKFGIHSRQELLDFIEDIEIDPGEDLSNVVDTGDERE